MKTAHASCCALMLHALYLRGHGTDDRNKILKEMKNDK